MQKDIAAISLFLQPLERELHTFLQQPRVHSIPGTFAVQGKTVDGLDCHLQVWLQQLA